MAEKPKKPQKLRARLPRGLADRGPAEIAATRAMVEKIREVYERYGFEPVETPAFEYTDTLGKFLPDQDRPNEGVFSFQDDDEQWISLRYDLTAPLARYVAENYGTEKLVLPYRSYRNGWVFRNEKPGPGRFRQFMQFDADTVGSASPAADAEMCMMAADTMEALGVPRGSYVVKVNNRKVLDGVMESIGLGGDENAGRRLTVLRAIDKLDKFPVDEIRKLLGTGRWDGGEEGKGDFTKGAELAQDEIHEVMTLVGSTFDVEDPKALPDWLLSDSVFVKGAVDPASGTFKTQLTQENGVDATPITNHATVRKLRAHFSGSDLITQGLDELEQIAELSQSAGYGSKRIRIDTSVVRGLEYYTGPVYEVELLLETKDEKGRPVRFGSVGGGGRYDGLVSRFRGEPVPATGFSIGVSRLQAALTLLGKLDTRPQAGPVVVTVFDRDRVADYQKMVATLRAANIRAELYLGNPKNMGNQLKYADRRNAPCVIIQGSDEKNDPAGPQIIVKDLILGAELASLEKDRDEYLQKQAEAQHKVPQSDLLDTVRKILDKHGVKWG
ncbi:MULTISPECIES: HisS family protein [Rhodopseudomonas]|uniref:Histidine--tRNA ligase n=2 Tax=Rhodopseudomonas TaxID=1073 RepID=A0A0D7EL62_RHOPL|nr:MULTISPECIES: HisS family protein [Rhodopseudomonas]KIZ40182.1 histidyl-tRNA synthase [Rhodopseudomonas palustris]MDF3811180.1 HisS family protein [Rhodopseudomonas sp. BAL398]WOK17462.1 HisS family protein [Rhodopseudomonas sp. BAL398]